MKILRAVFCFFIVAIFSFQVQAQNTDSPSNTGAAQPAAPLDNASVAGERLLIATSSLDYPVTPSDRYTLSYRRSTAMSDRTASASDVVVQTLQVAGDYSLDLGLFGKVSARGLRFIEVKAKVEALVSDSYARSYPLLTIESVGVFRVNLGGMVAQPRIMNAWGLTRLGELVELADESGASLRSVELRSAGGESRRCDLLKAMRTGNLSQNPIVRPGDAIILQSAASAPIKISGEVRHPGSYELLPGEELRDLIEIFGGGLTGIAETAKIRIDRLTPRGLTAQYIPLAKAYSPPISLEGCIGVSILSRMDDRPFVWFEGAVTAMTSAGEAASRSGADASASTRADVQAAAPVGDNNRIMIPIYEGEMLSDALREVKRSFAPSAELSSASIFRQGSATPIAIDLQPLLAMANSPSDIRLEPYDRIFIPTLKSRITVHGAVFAGGSFPYQPNSPASYYIGLAGGVDPEKNKNGHYWILDQNGKRRKAKDTLMPNDRIYVPLNSFTYNVVRYTPVITGIVTLAVILAPYVDDYINN